MRRFIAIVAIGPLLTAGCTGVRPPGLPTVAVVRSTVEGPREYVIGCPDVLAVRFADLPQLDCLVAVDLDGRLPIADSLQPHVDGGTLADAHRAVASCVGCGPGRVSVQLADARTKRVYLFGPEQNRQQVIPYIGTERLVDFLVRTGWRPGCSDPRDVCVVRPNIADGATPQVFRADLRAIQHGDHTTNVLIESGDQVYVGETRRSSFARMLPDWMKAGYLRVVGLECR